MNDASTVEEDNKNKNNMMLKRIASFALNKGISLHIVKGSVLDFSPTPSAGKAVGAIVNAANPGCLGGGGVDGAINDAGGPRLWKDREALPLIGAGGVRCRTGDATITGPNKYGSLKVPYVIHAVGPAYFDYDYIDEGDSSVDDMSDNDKVNNNHDKNPFEIPDNLLRSAYQKSLDRCYENEITDVAFSLLSAGIFRGRRSLQDVLTVGIQGIHDWCKEKDDCGAFSSITLCGFSDKEARLLMKVCEETISLQLISISTMSNNGERKNDNSDEKISDTNQKQILPTPAEDVTKDVNDEVVSEPAAATNTTTSDTDVANKTNEVNLEKKSPIKENSVVESNKPIEEEEEEEAWNTNKPTDEAKN